jgi:hypothetical protein
VNATANTHPQGQPPAVRPPGHHTSQRDLVIKSLLLCPDSPRKQGKT